MVHLSDTKEIILALKKVAKEKQLSIDKILALVNEKEGECALSRSSIQRVFAKGSEDSNFRFDTTLKPLCNALLNIEADDEDDSADTQAMKSILRYKKELIEDYVKQNTELKNEMHTIKEREKDKYTKRLEEETRHFNESISFMRNQISLKDQRIDLLLESNTKLLEANNKLLEQVVALQSK